MTDLPRPSFYFMSLRLENVRCFKDQQVLDLSDGQGRPAPWTLILGDNGVGKTTLLECLMGMRPVKWDPPEEFPRKHTQPRQTLTQPDLMDWENTVLERLLRAGSTDVQLEVQADLHLVERLRGLRSEASQAQPLTVGLHMEREKERLKVAEPVGETPYPQGDPDATLFAYGATRRVETNNLDQGEADGPAVSPFSLSSSLYDSSEILLRLDHRAAKYEGPDEERLEKVKQMIVDLLPDPALRDEVNGIEIRGPTVLASPAEPSGIFFHTSFGAVPLAGLSLGYQTMLAWVLDLAWRLFRRYPESLSPLSGPAIVLVDEMDLHLHPRWQREIRSYLTGHFPNVQFIATAHSPLMAQASADANLAVLKREGDHVVIVNDPVVLAGWRVDQVVTSDLFDMPSWSPPVEALFAERDRLLTKLGRSAEEEARLSELEQELAKLPTSENREDEEAMDIIRRAAALVKARGLDQP